MDLSCRVTTHQGTRGRIGPGDQNSTEYTEALNAAVLSRKPLGIVCMCGGGCCRLLVLFTDGVEKFEAEPSLEKWQKWE